MREVQRDISLRALADASITFQGPVANGGDAALANLETAQKIVASPKLLEQFKKDTAVNKKAIVSAVAWLKDLRTPKEAEAAAAQVRFYMLISPYLPLPVAWKFPKLTLDFFLLFRSSLSPFLLASSLPLLPWPFS